MSPQSKTWNIVAFLPIMSIIPTGTSFTQSSANYRLKKTQINQGGTGIESTAHTLFNAIGQSSTIGEAASTHYKVSSVFFGENILKTYTDTPPPKEVTTPHEFNLLQNYPNPFNPETTIEYLLPHTAEVILTIHNTLGQEIRRLVNSTRNAGQYSVPWDGKDEAGDPVASGIYFYQVKMTSGQQIFRGIRKLMLIK